ENWNRPQDEVDALMNLIVVSIEQQTPDLIKNNVRLTTIGNMERMPAFAAARLRKCMEDTGHCTGLVLCLALSYSSRWEIVEACRQMAREAVAGKLNPDDIDDDMMSAHLATCDMPDPDLLIRTGGEKRLSNFLLYQCAYSELYFCDTLWPDFDRSELMAAIEDYSKRKRRFGR
ncbi:MAG: di-trans,poly-cis-decaprenylcistransferase, partial [Clostridia bacterium]|nr:di-trans,poly-cis-decaprenylcistransferase [Clostridia bacterium]